MTDEHEGLKKLRDLTDDEEDDEEENDWSSSSVTDGVETQIITRAVKSDYAEYTDDKKVLASPNEIAVWFALICMNVPEAELPEIDEE